MNAQKKTAFIKTVYSYYKKHGRHDLPWRKTTNPYKIVVSEVMLQQTQVSRVLEKYKAFLKDFPTVHSLANAPLQKVLAAWSGLGYNRRAKFLQKMAQTIITDHKGKFPKTLTGLTELPGIGAYTAGAIMAFAYNEPGIFIETNIRTVYMHHFHKTTDKELLPYIEATLDHTNPREWYWALMDYGSYLKSQGVIIHRTNKHYKKQSTFKGSLREVRGGIVKVLTKRPATIQELQNDLSFEKERITKALETLVQEEFIIKKSSRYYIF